MVSGLMRREGSLHEALVSSTRVHEAEGHADVAAGEAPTASDTRWLEELLRRIPVEVGEVDADAQPAVGDDCHAGWHCAVLTTQGLCLLKLPDCVGDELSCAWRLAPCFLLAGAYVEARLRVVPEHLPRHIGQVGSFPGGSPRACPKGGARRAFLCEREGCPSSERRAYSASGGGPSPLEAFGEELLLLLAGVLGRRDVALVVRVFGRRSLVGMLEGADCVLLIAGNRDDAAAP